MTERDYGVWMAVRAVGEGGDANAVRSRPRTSAAYVRSPEFELAAFKGQGLTFRDWNGQLRQPILIAGPRVLVSVSPQEGIPASGVRTRHAGLRPPGEPLHDVTAAMTARSYPNGQSLQKGDLTT